MKANWAVNDVYRPSASALDPLLNPAVVVSEQLGTPPLTAIRHVRMTVPGMLSLRYR